MIWFKYRLRHYNFPRVAAQALPVLGLRKFLVPGDYGQNFGVSLGRARQGSGSHGRLAHCRRPIVVEKLPAVGIHAYLQAVAVVERRSIRATRTLLFWESSP